MIKLDDSFELLQINSPRELLSIGKALRNCIRPGSAYLDDLRSGDSHFWTLRQNGKLRGLFKVDKDRNEFDEFDGPANEPIGCSKEILLSIQRKLGVSGDEIEEFQKTGAFNLFSRDKVPSATSVQVGTSTLQIWGQKGEAVFRDQQGKWSKLTFEKTDTFWQRRGRLEPLLEGEMDEGDPLKLALRSAKLHEVLHRYQPQT